METTTTLELIDPARLIPSAVNPRVHTQRQIRELRASIREFGVVSPVLVDKDLNIIAGHAVVDAALAECVPAVPCVYVEHLTPTQRKAYMIADNRLAEKSRWDDELLDTFCGSGTSVLAAETYGRKCRAMELSPHNCDVIIARWEEMTGRKAVLLEGGADDAGTETAD